MPRTGRRQLAARRNDPRIDAAISPVLDAGAQGVTVVIGGGNRTSARTQPDDADPQPPRRASAGRHPLTGCRADTLFGVWLMPPAQLAHVVDVAWAVVESGQLVDMQAQARAMREAELRRGRDDDDDEDEPSAAAPSLAVDEHGIAHIEVSGPLTKHPTSFTPILGGTAYTRVRSQFAEAVKLHGEGKVKGVFVDADSWGGTAEGCTECAGVIRRAADVMPVAFHAEDKATSGMQWLASMGTRLTGGRAAIFGSVGARTSLMDRSENFRRQGLKPYVFTTGEHKAIGEPGVEITDTQRATMQRHIEQVGQPFIDDVAKHRRMSPEQLAEVRKAGLHVGPDALRLGLVDALCTREQALADLQSNIAQARTSGGAAPGSTTTPPAPNNNPSPGVTTMPFTAAQLERARKLPNCSAVGENDVDVVLNAATQVADNLAKVTAERDDYKGRSYPALTPEVKAARVAAARSRIELLGHQGKINAAQRAKLESRIGEAGKENDAPFIGVQGQTPIEQALDVFADAPVNAPPTGTQTGPQAGTQGGGAAQGGTTTQSGVASGVIALDDPRLNTNPAAVGAEQGEAYKRERLAQLQASK